MKIEDLRAYCYLKESGDLPDHVMAGCEPIIYQAMIESGIQERDEYPETVDEMIEQGCVNDFLVDCDVDDRELVLEYAEKILRRSR